MACCPFWITSTIYLKYETLCLLIVVQNITSSTPHHTNCYCYSHRHYWDCVHNYASSGGGSHYCYNTWHHPHPPPLISASCALCFRCLHISASVTNFQTCFSTLNIVKTDKDMCSLDSDVLVSLLCQCHYQSFTSIVHRSKLTQNYCSTTHMKLIQQLYLLLHIWHY